MKILFNGCSYTAGVGLPGLHSDENNFANVMIDLAEGNNAVLENIAKSGASNQEIFESTLEKIVQTHYDKVFVGWTAYPRYFYQFGFENHDYLGHRFSPRQANGFQRWKHLSKSDLETTNRVICSSHDHYEILTILKYSSILNKLHNNIYFINVLASWPLDFFTKKDWQLPSELDNYTKDLLDTENRTDNQIKQLYNKQHSDYQEITESDSFWTNWLNLYQPAKCFKVDIGDDNCHPGPQTYKKFGHFLFSQYKKLSS
jgi:hypothetical protein